MAGLLWRTPGGEATVSDERGTRRRSTATCAHCSRLVEIPPGELPEQRLMGRCFYCWDEKRPLSGLICAECVRKGVCEREIEKLERAVEKRRAVSGYFQCR